MSYADWTGVADINHRHGFTFYSFSTQAPCFAVGILIFRLLEQRESYALAAGIFGLVTIIALWPFYEHSDRYYLLNVAGYGAIAYSLGNGRLEPLVNRLICGIGLVSYSAYFWHFILIALSDKYFPQLTPLHRATLVIPVTLLVSTMTYLVIERPMMRFGARVASTVGRAPSQSPRLTFSSE
jgi:peptidoglycan/LPS O-acetylase OafA/YrhL